MAQTQNPAAAASSDEKEKPKLVIDLNYPPAAAPAPAPDDGDGEIVKENNYKESSAKGLRGFEVGSGSSVSKRSRRFTEEEKGKRIIVVVVDDDDEEALLKLRLGPAPAVKPDDHKALLQASNSCVGFRALIRR